jgi:hypothetical protein
MGQQKIEIDVNWAFVALAAVLLGVVVVFKNPTLLDTLATNGVRIIKELGALIK